MGLHEQSFNQIFGEALRGQFRSWRDSNVVRIETTGQLRDKQSERPDVVVVPPGGYPVVFESAFAGTADLDRDALLRIGVRLKDPRKKVLTSFVIVVPQEFRGENDVVVRERLAEQDFSLAYAIFMQGKDDQPERFPEMGYAKGTLAQLASLASVCSVPGHIVDARIEEIYSSLEDIAARMGAVLGKGPCDRLAEVLGLANPESAMRVCVCIWLDSFLAQERLADVESSVGGISQYGQEDDGLLNRVFRVWDEVLDINYTAIFAPARGTLRGAPAVFDGFLREVIALAEGVVRDSLHHILDIGGELLPRLAPDRKATAAFYTLRESADLLTGLVPESCYEALAHEGCEGARAGLVGDFACGTGSLLVSAYRRIRRQIDAAGSLPDARHRWWMEEGLFGVDIQPIAVHLTAMRLSSFAMDRSYRRSNIIYAGLDGSGSTGALELLHQPVLHDLFHSSTGASQKDLHAPAADGKFGLCVMNPPYSGVGFGTSVFRVSSLKEIGIKASQKRYGHLIKDTFANGKAGMGSAFAALADKKLFAGGVYASVLPATVGGTESWADFRRQLWRNYSDVTVVSMAGDGHQSFSADTGMEEVLVIATKGKPRSPLFHFVSLYAFPRHPVETEAFTHAIRAAIKGAQAGQPKALRVGVDIVGQHLACALAEDEPWKAACIRDLGLVSLIEVFHQYAAMPAVSDDFDLMASHMQIGHIDGASAFGAYTFYKIVPGVTPNNPALWANDSQTQHTIGTLPTHDGEPVAGREKLRERLQKQRTHFFWGRNLRVTSQAASLAYTMTRCLGGSAWAGLTPRRVGVDKAMCLWANSILGLVWRWLYSGKQQQGRSRMQLDATRTLRIPRFDEHAIDVAAAHFDELIRLPLRPCAYAEWDDNRKQIDAVVCKMMGFDKDKSEALEQLRRRWCREPGVHGGKLELVGLLRRDGLMS